MWNSSEDKKLLIPESRKGNIINLFHGLINYFLLVNMLEKAFQKIGLSTQKKQEGLCHNGIENSGYNTDEEGFNIMTKGKLFLIFILLFLFSKGVLADDEKLESVASFPSC